MNIKEFEDIVNDLQFQKKFLKKQLQNRELGIQQFERKANSMLSVVHYIAEKLGFDLNKNPYQNQKWKNYS